MMKSEFVGNIGLIRAVEDCIRASRKYTKGVLTLRRQHPIQGEEFPSKAFREIYEVYPDLEEGLTWDSPAGVGLELLWGNVTAVNIRFYYDYKTNKAQMTIHRDSPETRQKLLKGIPGFGDVLEQVEQSNGNRESEEATEVGQAVGNTHRNRAGSLPRS